MYEDEGRGVPRRLQSERRGGWPPPELRLCLDRKRRGFASARERDARSEHLVRAAVAAASGSQGPRQGQRRLASTDVRRCQSPHSSVSPAASAGQPQRPRPRPSLVAPRCRRRPGHHWWRRAHAPLATPRTSPPKEPPSSLGPAQEAGEPLALERSRRGPVRRRLRGSGGIGDVAQLSPSRLSAGARPGRRAALCRARFWCRHLEPVLDCGMAHVWLVFSSPTALHSISAELVAGCSYASSVPKQNMKELLIICLLHPPPPFSDTNRRYSYRVAVHLAGKPFISTMFIIL